MNNNHEFKRILGRWDSVAIIIAIVIGVGIFRVPAEVAGYLNSSSLILFAWLVGGAISLLGALCYSELSASFPETGGSYIYLRESYGRPIAFLFGWSELLVVRTGSIAAVSFVAAEYLASFLAIDPSLVKSIAAAIILILSFVNIIGLKHGKRVQDALTVTKILSIVVIILVGLMSRKGSFSNFQPGMAPVDRGIVPLFFLALIPILWTYGGWHENVFVAGETRRASKTVPLALLLGVFSVTFIYLAMNFLYIYMMPVAGIANSQLIGSDVLGILYGEPGRRLLDILVIIFSLGAINAMIMTGSRVTYAMAKDNAIFRYISEVNKRYATPHRAIIINGVWSIFLIVLGTFNQLLFFTGIIVWLFFALIAVGLFILRKKFPDIDRPYKVWGYPFVPIVFCLICVALFINTLLFSPLQASIGLCILFSGVPVYILSRKIG